MGLFSKLFGNAIDEKTVKGVFDDLSKAVNGPGRNKQSEQTNYSAPAAAAPEISDEKPAEENQYNFKGTYIQYFDKVFREEFPEYEISYERSSLNRTSTIFTFRSSGNVVLYVELMTERSTANRFREKCKKEGTPYLRYYYDHNGWWNTRKYITDRTRKALG